MSTNTRTYTLTDSKYLGSKIAADLRQMQLFYGSPSNEQMDKYIDEFVILLKEGYLESVDYGFKNDDKWIVAVSYEVSVFNNIDNNPGRVPIGVDINGARWGSFLRYSTKYYLLSDQEREKVESQLPFSRGGADDPQYKSSATYDKSYGSGEVELKRKTYN